MNVPNQLAQNLPLEKLDPHPANANAMPLALMQKLRDEIERTGLYPPIIVRPIGPRYQILDGHHRAAVLQELGRTDAQCVVWQADDQQALLLLATLNQLSGSDDPRKRAALIARLSRSLDIGELAKRLPEDRERVRKMLALHRAAPSPAAPRPIEQMPVSLHFFMLPGQRRAVERKLREVPAAREAALLHLLGIESEGRDDG